MWKTELSAATVAVCAQILSPFEWAWAFYWQVRGPLFHGWKWKKELFVFFFKVELKLNFHLIHSSHSIFIKAKMLNINTQIVNVHNLIIKKWNYLIVYLRDCYSLHTLYTIFNCARIFKKISFYSVSNVHRYS